MKPVPGDEVARELVGVQEVDLAEQEGVVVVGDPPPTAVDLQDAGLVEVEAMLEALPTSTVPGSRSSPRPRTRSGLSGRSGCFISSCATSIRNPSTPRSSQNRATSCMASRTAGLRQLRSGCSRRNVWR